MYQRIEQLWERIIYNWGDIEVTGDILLWGIRILSCKLVGACGYSRISIEVSDMTI